MTLVSLANDARRVLARAGRPATTPDDRFEELRTIAQSASSALESRGPEEAVAFVRRATQHPIVTSSFGIDSAVLLHIVSVAAPEIPVVFLDTGLHFEETMEHRRRLGALLGNPVIDVAPRVSLAQQQRQHGDELYRRDPDTCCRIRKVAPLRWALQNRDGWLTGVRRDQATTRAHTPLIAVAEVGGRPVLKCAPIAGWDGAAMTRYLEHHGLPRHPLAEQGYTSVGCGPCTRRPTTDDPRDGRWPDASKTECGLHAAGMSAASVTGPGRPR